MSCECVSDGFRRDDRAGSELGKISQSRQMPRIFASREKLRRFDRQKIVDKEDGFHVRGAFHPAEIRIIPKR